MAKRQRSYYYHSHLLVPEHIAKEARQQPTELGPACCDMTLKIVWQPPTTHTNVVPPCTKSDVRTFADLCISFRLRHPNHPQQRICNRQSSALFEFTCVLYDMWFAISLSIGPGPMYPTLSARRRAQPYGSWRVPPCTPC